MSSDLEIRQFVYRCTVETGRPPRSAVIAAEFGMQPGEVLASFKRLNEKKLLALAPDSGEIVMAPPFSAVPTPFPVTVAGKNYFANCVWDSLGIPAALHQDGTIDSSCACCGESIILKVVNGTPACPPAVAHFAVPAAQWWDDIVYT